MTWNEYTFIPVGSEPGGNACMSVWRLPQGERIPMPASGFLTWRPKLRKNDRRNTGKNLLQFTRPPVEDRENSAPLPPTGLPEV